MGTRVSYPVEVKMKAIEMRLAGVPVKEVMEELNIRNYTQLRTWMRWYRNGILLSDWNSQSESNIPSVRDLSTKVKQLSYRWKIVI